MRPTFDTFAATQKASQEKAFETGSKALGGTNSDIVANRSAIRMANMNAAEALKAELAALKPLKPRAGAARPYASAAVSLPPPPPPTQSEIEKSSVAEDIGIPGLETVDEPIAVEQPDGELSIPTEPTEPSSAPPEVSATLGFEQDATSTSPFKGVKRKLDEIERPDQEGEAIDEEERSETPLAKKRIVHADGTVESEDTVK
jgi:5'-3' exoribonuclease 2